MQLCYNVEIYLKYKHNVSIITKPMYLLINKTQRLNLRHFH